MVGVNDIVITGIGCVSPLGIGHADFRDRLLQGQCAVRQLITLDDARTTVISAAPIDDFNGKLYVTPRKALKVMSREVQTAYSAAHLAWKHANVADNSLQPDRVGVVFGAEMIPGDHNDLIGAVEACKSHGSYDSSRWGTNFGKQIYPLWMLKNLPNMPACHVGIAIDARGPNNTIAQEEVGSLLALQESAMVIERGQTDLMVVGGVGGRVEPTRLAYRIWQIYEHRPCDRGNARPHICAPFDVSRNGIVPSEGAGALVIERRSHAVQRGAKILGRVCGFASRCAAPQQQYRGSRLAIASAAAAALKASGIAPQDLDHVNAQGFAQPELDIVEAQAIHEVVGNVPVCAFSSYFGTAGAACGLLELESSLIGMHAGKRLPVLGHRQTDGNCPIEICEEITQSRKSHFLKLSFTPHGHAAAAVIECET